jgi:signal recognition particle subunit SRP54
MEALPGGLGQMLGSMPPGMDSSARLKRFCCIMQSMTKKELDCDVEIDRTRLIRIARGCGVPPQEVAALMQTHKQMEKMVGGMNKAGLLKGGDAGFASKMSRNPQAVMAAMQKSMDPRMLSSMGGAGNLMNMIKSLAGGAGPAGAGGGDMAKKMKDMMKGFGFG